MSETKITILKNGPLLVNGEVSITDSDGKPVQVPGTQFALCRCGASTRKPFCDGTHSKIGFQSAEAAVPESKE
jgi:CDGSH-type Zn-finger protein